MQCLVSKILLLFNIKKYPEIDNVGIQAQIVLFRHNLNTTLLEGARDYLISCPVEMRTMFQDIEKLILILFLKGVLVDYEESSIG